MNDAPDLSDPAALALAVVQLRAEGMGDAADRLLGHAGGVRKAMTEGVGSEGGFLVPAGYAVVRKRRKRRARRIVKSLFDGLGE